MTWCEALDKILKGQKVRRRAWNSWLYVCLNAGYVMRSTLTDGMIMYNPYKTELEAWDWEVVKQPAEPPAEPTVALGPKGGSSLRVNVPDELTEAQRELIMKPAEPTGEA